VYLTIDVLLNIKKIEDIVTKKLGCRDQITPCPTCMGLNKDGCLNFWDKTQPLIPLLHISLLNNHCMHYGLNNQAYLLQHSHPHTQKLIRELTLPNSRTLCNWTEFFRHSSCSFLSTKTESRRFLIHSTKSSNFPR
jgi:hypothetical protein